MSEETGGATPIVVPDGIEPLVGWRGWDVHDDGLLYGVNHAEPWPPGKVAAEAICKLYEPKVEFILHHIPPEHFAEVEVELELLTKRFAENWHDPHEPPNEGCHCGLYARTEPSSIADGDIWGQVRAWGKVVKGAYGFRAQYAQVSGLFLHNRGTSAARAFETSRYNLIRGLAERYGVPILDPAEARTPVHEIRSAWGGS